MRRNEALIPLSHDHHHVLKQVRGLKKAASSTKEARLEQARTFLAFFETAGIQHFRDEEEVVFPLAVRNVEARALLRRAMVEHLEIHALVLGLREATHGGDVQEVQLATLADTLERHVRLEEKELFPLIERLVPQALAVIELDRRSSA